MNFDVHIIIKCQYLNIPISYAVVTPGDDFKNCERQYNKMSDNYKYFFQ